MKQCAFETTGCNHNNLAQIRSAAVTVAGITAATVAISSNGSYKLFIQCRNLREGLLSELNAALKPLGVTARHKTETEVQDV